MFKEWRLRKKREARLKEAAKKDEFLTRLRNSCMCLSGVSHTSSSGNEDFLSLHEIEGILYDELYRRAEEQAND